MAIKIRSGDLRWKVRFDRRKALTGDTDGNPQGGYETFIIAKRVKLLPTRGGELTIGDRMAGKSSFDMWVPADSEARRVRPGDRIADITSDDPADWRLFRCAFAEIMDDRGEWILMQLEATTGEDGRDGR